MRMSKNSVTVFIQCSKNLKGARFIVVVFRHYKTVLKHRTFRYTLIISREICKSITHILSKLTE